MIDHSSIFLTVLALLAALFLIGYLFGSIPFGFILTRLCGAGDIRAIGSGNIGATNVLRTGRKGLAAATLVCDALKGTAAILAAWGAAWWLFDGRVYGFPGYPGIVAALGAFIGHLFPVWLKFKGGKGVATFLGCLIGLCFPAALVFGAVWLGTAFATRYSSLAALAASAISALSLFYFSGIGPMAYVGLFMVVLLWWKHRDNIKRLLASTEGKIGRKG